MNKAKTKSIDGNDTNVSGNKITLTSEDKNSMYRELELIQNNIKRMASNSFMIKGWTVTLVVGSLLLRVTDLQLILPFIPVLSFWFLDTYFLYIERKFRELYQWVVDNRPKTQEKLFDMTVERFRKKKCRQRIKEIVCVFASKNLTLFYLPVLAVVILYVVLSLV